MYSICIIVVTGFGVDDYSIRSGLLPEDSLLLLAPNLGATARLRALGAYSQLTYIHGA